MSKVSCIHQNTYFQCIPINRNLRNIEKTVRQSKNPAVKDAAERYLEALRRTLEKADGLDEVFAKHITDKGGKYIVFCANFVHMQQMIDKASDWIGLER